MVCLGVFRIQAWMLITRRSASPATCSGFIQAFWASKACWSNLGNMRLAAKPGPLISSTLSIVALPILRMPALSSECHDAADRLSLVHQVECVVDLLDRHHVGDERIDVDLLVPVPVDDPRDVAPALGAAERRAHPLTAGHQLERPGRDLLAGARDADDDRLAPAAMAAFQRL